MANAHSRRHVVRVNRAPVLTLWAAVVAERLGFDHDEALTLGRAVAGLNAYSKGVRLGLIEPTPAEVQEKRLQLRATDRVMVDLEIDQIGGKSGGAIDSPSCHRYSRTMFRPST
jgi:hypothetical protein